MGSPEGSEIFDPGSNEPKKDEQGNVIITRLNEKELMAIAEKTNGSYQVFTNTDEVAGKLEANLGSMDQRTVTEDSLVNYRYYFPWFLGLALVLLVIELIVSERKKLIKTNHSLIPKALPLYCLFIMMMPLNLFAQNEKALIKKGNKAYEKKEYENAVNDYKQVTTKNSGNAVAQYNLGNALYRSQKTEDAIAAYDQAADLAKGKEDRAKAFYNKGVVLQNGKKIPECIDAYKRALKLNPADEDARQNLQKALVQQKQQQQQEKKDKQNQQPKKEDKQQEQKKPKDEKEDQPKPQPSRMSQKDAAEKLKALMEQERNLQDKLRKVQAGSPSKPEKDW